MNMQDTSQTLECLSALVDSELAPTELPDVMAGVGDSNAALERWHTYHLVGDVLRQGAAAHVRSDAGFVGRLRERLREEPGIATVSIADSPRLTGAGDLNDGRLLPVNQSSFRWKVLAAVATLTSVAVVAWHLSGLTGDGDARLAQSPAVAQPEAPAEPAVMIRDPHLDALMAAHKQFGGTSALQMPAGFLRNATFEGPAR